MADLSLRALIARVPPTVAVSGSDGVTIRAVELDSRKVTPGALFIAVRGEHADGHDFIGDAIRNGASAVLFDAARTDVRFPDERIARVAVADVRRALSVVSAAFYGEPSHALQIVGVTGTNGKTTTVQMAASILEAAGARTGVIGTIGAWLDARRWSVENTTPLPPQLHALLAQMQAGGARAVAMEVSSHALALGRVEDVRFAVGAFTNLTRDHLDFHGTREAYAQAKRRLFDLAERCVFNADDPYGARWAAELRARKPTLTFALDCEADLIAREIEVRADGSAFSLDGMRVRVRLPGRFNVANALCAIACARHLGVSDAVAARGIANVERVPGRMEHVGGNDLDVVVDYSHTPDSLENALRTLRETSRGRLLVVFGCGGDRDRGKRPQMGEIAARLADRSYVTSDNPRSEDPRAILDEIVAGMGDAERTIDVDRRAAIFRAIEDAHPGDTVLVAGKGHEAYQIVGADVLPFDDAQVAREALAVRGRAR